MYDKNSVYESRGGGSVQICHISLDTIENTLFKRENTSIFNHFRAAMPVSFHTEIRICLVASFIHSLQNYIYPSLSLSLSAYMSPSRRPVSVLGLSLPINPCKCTSRVFTSSQTQLLTCSRLESPSLTVSLRSLTGPYSHPDRNASPSSNHFKVCL